MPSWGGGAQGAASGAQLGSYFGPWGTGIGAGIGGLIGLFKGGGSKKPKAEDDPNDPTNMLSRFGQQKMQTGEDLIGDGSDAMRSVLSYYKDLTGNDPAALLQATAPQRGRVMDQYDTARKAISSFSPRGGAGASIGAQSYLSEASDLSDVTNEARTDAFAQQGQIGQNLLGLGLSSQQLASADFDTVLRAILTREGHDVSKRGQNMDAWGGIGEAAGSILADIFLKRGAA
jgi:hypothetical protein